MRTWQHVGFNAYAEALIRQAVKVEVIEIEDVWYGEGPELEKYTMADGKVYFSYVQACPWSSGPMTFMALKRGNGHRVHKSLWTDDQIDSQV